LKEYFCNIPSSQVAPLQPGNVAVKMEQTVITLVVLVFALQDGGEDTAARPVLLVSMASIVKIFVIVPMGQNVASILLIFFQH
jgi:hypothetical protein